jgi:hypothetical protein
MGKEVQISLDKRGRATRYWGIGLVGRKIWRPTLNLTHARTGGEIMPAKKKKKGAKKKR